MKKLTLSLAILLLSFPAFSDSEILSTETAIEIFEDFEDVIDYREWIEEEGHEVADKVEAIYLEGFGIEGLPNQGEAIYLVSQKITTKSNIGFITKLTILAEVKLTYLQELEDVPPVLSSEIRLLDQEHFMDALEDVDDQETNWR